MLQKPWAGPARDFKRPFNDGDALHLQSLQPPPRLVRRGPLRHMRRQPFTLDGQSIPAHLLVDSLPDGIERAERGKGEHDLPTGRKMFDQSLHRLESLRAQEHDGEIAGDPLECGVRCGQRAHVDTLESQPRKLAPLNGARTRDLAPAGIDACYGAGRTDLFGEVEGWNAMSAGDVEDGQPWTQVEVLQQDFGKRRRPVILRREGPCLRLRLHAPASYSKRREQVRILSALVDRKSRREPVPVTTAPIAAVSSGDTPLP